MKFRIEQIVTRREVFEIEAKDKEHAERIVKSLDTMQDDVEGFDPSLDMELVDDMEVDSEGYVLVGEVK